MSKRKLQMHCTGRERIDNPRTFCKVSRQRLDELMTTACTPDELDEYVCGISTTDQYARLTASNTAQHISLCSCWPIFFEMTTAAVCNAWVISRWLKTPQKHKGFRLQSVRFCMLKDGQYRNRKAILEQQHSALEPTF